LEEIVAAPGSKAENTALGIRHADHVAPSIRKKLALTSLTSYGRSVGIVRLRTEATEFFLSSGTILILIRPMLLNRPVVGPGINYTGPREAVLEFVICQFKCNLMFVNMPHRIYKCTNTLYDYAIINY
jgi:hypothetical protein